MKIKARVPAGILIAVLGVFSGLAQNREAAVLTNLCIYQAGAAGGTNCGRAEFGFKLSSQGRYYVGVQGKGPAGQGLKFCINIDKEPDILGVLELALTNGVPGQAAGFSTNAPRCFDIPAGAHKLIIVGKSAPAQLEKLILIPEASLPPRPSPPENLTNK